MQTCRKATYLQCDQLVIYYNILGKEVRTDRRFVLGGKFIVYVLIHQRGLPDSTVTQNNNLQKDPFAVSFTIDHGHLFLYTQYAQSIFANAYYCLTLSAFAVTCSWCIFAVYQFILLVF